MFIANTGHGITRASRAGNGVWSVEHLLSDHDVRCLASDPLNPKIVYAGTQGKGVLRSEDRGKTWRLAGMDGHIVKTLSVSRSEPGALYAGTKPAGLFVSRDRGESWDELDAFRQIPGRWLWLSPAELPFTAYVQGIALSPINANVIVVGIEAGAVVRSADGGRTWTGHRKGALRDCHSITFHASDGDWVYEAGGTGAGASFSQNAGEHWTQPREGLDRHYGWACAADPVKPDIWYISASPLPKGFGPPPAHVEGKADAGIFRMKGNSRWEMLTGGLPQPLNSMPYALLTAPDTPGHLYAGLSNGDVWHSANYGDSWQQLPFNLGGIHRTLIMV
jgi:hypothetical protein